MVYFDKVFETHEQADKFIEEYYAAYHPAGYGTWCRKEDLPNDGGVKVKVSRGSSCD
jgi:hypothetical protein